MGLLRRTNRCPAPVLLALAACGPGQVSSGSGSADTDTSSLGDGDPGDGDPGDGDGDPCPPGGCLDLSPGPDPDPCAMPSENCDQFDILLVIDNSATMAEEQLNVAANLPLLLDTLDEFTDENGEPLELDVHLMVTTTDVGHPLCTDTRPPGYAPAMGAPQTTPCSERLEHFISPGPDATDYSQACALGCPVPVAPTDPFIAFDAGGTNVPGDDLEAALGCLGPQGVIGCEFESPLEAMLLALDPSAPWNSGDEPFVRPSATLAVVLITDEPDCSVLAPEGHAAFTDPAQDGYWEINPETGTKTRATSAVCWNAGVACGAPDQDGVYPDCDSSDTGVLHPVERYLAVLRDELQLAQNKRVFMLPVVGVPPVTMHNPEPPFEPIVGGIFDLVYRDWVDAPYPAGDLLPGDAADAATKQFEFGIGPGCTSTDNIGGVIGQALPPARIAEVCQGLDEIDEVHCCIESICDQDFSAVLNCMMPLIVTHW